MSENIQCDAPEKENNDKIDYAIDVGKYHCVRFTTLVIVVLPVVSVDLVAHACNIVIALFGELGEEITKQGDYRID